MMRNIQTLVLVFSFMTMLSCSQKLTAVYYFDNTKLDDGEITASYLKGFFSQDKNVHKFAVRSNVLNEELMRIRDSIKNVTSMDEIDDGKYGYAFITSETDTLFSDYNLTYWRYSQRGTFYKSDALRSIIKKEIQ